MTRTEPQYAADERTMLVSFLDYFRETMCALVEDLSPEQLRWIPCDGANSIGGLIRHLVYVEEWWFHTSLLDRPREFPWNDDDPNPDQDFVMPDDLSGEGLVASYRAQWARSNEIIDGMSLDTVALHERSAKRGVTLRWILVHMIEETARHAGHADITRQLIDGRTGF
jgi:uncharacterized damage-inducible protein DinB